MRYLFLMLGCLAPLFAWGADPETDIGERFIQDRLEQQRIERQREQSSIELELEERDKSVDQLFGQCFDITEVAFDGNRVIDDETINELAAEYEGECLNKGLINRLLSDINNLYIAEGFITSRAYLPQQDLSQGVLNITIVEGEISQIDINDNTRSDRWKLWWALPAEEGEVLQLRKIEQGVDQINRVSSANAQMKLWPGEKAGETRVQILSEPQDEVRGRISMDNDGSASTGERRIKLELEADNLMSINDSMGLFLITSQDTNALAYNLGLPFRNWSFNYSYSYSEYLEFISDVADLFGRTLTQTLSGDYLLARGARGQSKLTFSVTHRNSRRTILGTALEPQNFASARVGYNQSYRADYGFWSFDLGYAQGVDWFNAQDDPAVVPDDFPVAEFEKLEASAYFTGALGRHSRYTGQLRGQYTQDPLYSSEQVHIGDRSTVRGYRDTAASGDYGLYWRNDVQFQWPPAWFRAEGDASTFSGLARLRPYVFVDAGRVKDRVNETRATISGGGLGLRYSGKRFNFDTSWGWGIESSPNGLIEGSEFYLNASWKAF